MANLPLSIYSRFVADTKLLALQSSLIFRDKPSNFLRQTALMMKRELYQQNEIIFQKNSAKNKMICLMVGSIEILSEDDDESSVFTMGPGSCLGESCLLVTLTAGNTVRACSYVELEVLYRNDFVRLIENFSDIYQEIYNQIIQRLYVEESNKSIRIVKDKLKLPKNVQKNNILNLYCITEKKEFNLIDKSQWRIMTNSNFLKLWNFFIYTLALYINISYPYCLILSNLHSGLQ